MKAPEDGKIYYRWSQDSGPFTITCTEEQLVAAINTYLPSNVDRLKRHAAQLGPIGALIDLASEMTAEDIAVAKLMFGKVVAD